MATIKPSLPKGTRDFDPLTLRKRMFIIDVIRQICSLHGFQSIETPAMENLSTLTGKYGEEGDQLMFKILNSGDFLKDASELELSKKNSRDVLGAISEKALRYDLTIPFARYVAMNQNDIAFPFKRLQIQPVWRADRPQKGRYREFYQCDADIIGSHSLLNEAELISITRQVLMALKLPKAVIKINHRKILLGIAETMGRSDNFNDMVVAIDKINKIGVTGVREELLQKGFQENEMAALEVLLSHEGSRHDKVHHLKNFLQGSEQGLLGLQELENLFTFSDAYGIEGSSIELDVSLARGLTYYTGAIFEIAAEKTSVSIGGGGRYDNLTGIFGLKSVSGVGVSFGIDRIYDLLDQEGLFPEVSTSSTVLVANMGPAYIVPVIALLKKLHEEKIIAQYYPDSAKLGKQFKYANDLGAPFVVIIGEDELAGNVYSLKNMQNGLQVSLAPEELLTTLKAHDGH